MMRTGTWEAFILEKKKGEKTVNINTVISERHTWKQLETEPNVRTNAANDNNDNKNQ